MVVRGVDKKGCQAILWFLVVVATFLLFSEDVLFSPGESSHFVTEHNRHLSSRNASGGDDTSMEPLTLEKDDGNKTVADLTTNSGKVHAIKQFLVNAGRKDGSSVFAVSNTDKTRDKYSIRASHPSFFNGRGKTAGILESLVTNGDKGKSAGDTREEKTVHPYGHKDIEQSAKHYMGSFTPRLFVFDGKDFKLFNILHKDQDYQPTVGGRAGFVVPLLAKALREQFPGRFEEGQPPFQVMYGDGDSIVSDCDYGQKGSCNTTAFAPLMAFSSVPKNASEFPSVQAFPNHFYAKCLYIYKVLGKNTNCKWVEDVADSYKAYEHLVPTVVWRGTDHAFLANIEEYAMSNAIFRPNFEKLLLESTKDPYASLFEIWSFLTPRWRAATLTAFIEHETSERKKKGLDVPAYNWIDVKFVGEGVGGFHIKLKEQKGLDVTGEKMDAKAQSLYKYLVDFGGGGGTTWRGTISKLLLPGLLFHHETQTKDWFFDLMIPWKHYVPIKWDISDLQNQYQWAQTNPTRAKEIAEEGSRLGEYLLSMKYMDSLYQDLFVDYLAKVVNAYEPLLSEKANQSSEAGDPVLADWEEVVTRYQRAGYRLEFVSACYYKAEKRCVTEMSPGNRVPFPADVLRED